MNTSSMLGCASSVSSTSIPACVSARSAAGQSADRVPSVTWIVSPNTAARRTPGAVASTLAAARRSVTRTASTSPA